MGIGVSIFLIAVGLILALAVNVNTDGAIDVPMIGWILVVVGIVGMLLAHLLVDVGRRRVPPRDRRPRRSLPSPSALLGQAQDEEGDPGSPFCCLKAGL